MISSRLGLLPQLTAIRPHPIGWDQCDAHGNMQHVSSSVSMSDKNKVACPYQWCGVRCPSIDSPPFSVCSSIPAALLDMAWRIVVATCRINIAEE